MEEPIRSPPQSKPGRFQRDRVLQVIVATAVAMAFADSSIVVLALPELYGDFDASIVGVSWVITIYNVAVTVAAPVVFMLGRRTSPVALAAVGLVLFLVASIGCAAATGLYGLLASRAAQGLGAALLLGASLPLLVALTGGRERAVAMWVAAGTLGIAGGPALGGMLTDVFDWRAIFVVQTPIAALALAAALQPAARRAASAKRVWPGRLQVAPAVALALTFAALVGALFLAVLLLVTVWDLGPLVGALVVSALPVGAIVVRPVSRALSPVVNIGYGALLLAGGLIALALLPASSVAYALPAMALSGFGLGFIVPPLTRASIPAHVELTRAATWSVGVRHVGLVAGLVAVAPLLSIGLDDGSERATVNGTAVLLDAPLPVRQKVPIALDVYREFRRTPRGKIPDLAAPFDERAGDEPGIVGVRDDLLDEVRAALTRGFRPALALSASFALLAGAVGLAFARSARR